MATNPIPPTGSQLIALAENMIDGLDQLGATLGITQVTAAGMQAALDPFIASDNDYNAARSALQAAYDAFHPQDDALSGWLGKVRAVLTTFFGNRWSPMWAQAGFTNMSTAVPGTISDRLGLALRVTAFFTANPSYEAASLGVTAAAGTALRDAAVSGQQAVSAASTVVKQKMAARSDAMDVLTAPMRMLIGILTALLAADDPRWQAFGLMMPSQAVAPGQPQNLALSPGTAQAEAKANAASAVNDAPGSVLATCDAVPLATRYRWRTRIAGFQSAYTLAASSTEPMAMLSNLPTGVPVEVIVQAVNGDRQGVPSAPVIYSPAAAMAAAAAKPLPVMAAAESTAAATALASNSSNGHGRAEFKANGNGHREKSAIV